MLLGQVTLVLTSDTVTPVIHIHVNRGLGYPQVACKFFESCSKKVRSCFLCTKVAQKLLQKKQKTFRHSLSLVGLVQKYANCKISKHSCAILPHSQHC